MSSCLRANTNVSGWCRLAEGMLNGQEHSISDIITPFGMNSTKQHIPDESLVLGMQVLIKDGAWSTFFELVIISSNSKMDAATLIHCKSAP